MKKLIYAFIVICAFVLNVQHVFADFNVNRWQYYKEVKSDSEGYVKVKIDGEIYDHSNLSDLRLIDSNGVETPYQLIEQEPKNFTDNNFQIYNLSSKGGSTQFYVRLANSRFLHSSIQITAQDENYKRVVSVEGGNDQKEWRLLKKSYIFALSEDSFVTRKKQVDYPKSNYNYLRVTIDNQKQEPLDLSQEVVVSFVEKEQTPQTLSLVSSRIKVKNEGNKTIIRLKLKHALPVRRIELNIESENYDRLIRVFTTEGGWQPIVDTNIYSYMTESINEINSNIDLNQTVVTKDLKIIVYNQDDQSLKINKADVFTEERYAVYKGAGSFKLYYGNQDANQPSYDLAKIITYVKLAGINEATASKEKINSSWQEPKKPWSEENRWVLILVIALVVSLLGLIVVNQLINAGQKID